MKLKFLEKGVILVSGAMVFVYISLVGMALYLAYQLLISDGFTEFSQLVGLQWNEWMRVWRESLSGV